MTGRLRLPKSTSNGRLQAPGLSSIGLDSELCLTMKKGLLAPFFRLLFANQRN